VGSLSVKNSKANQQLAVGFHRGCKAWELETTRRTKTGGEAAAGIALCELQSRGRHLARAGGGSEGLRRGTSYGSSQSEHDGDSHHGSFRAYGG
jgi:hypothetical protein